MGGIGSGRRWHWSAASTTEDYLSIDVRRWQRDGLLTAGRSFGWHWSREGERVATIRVRVNPEQVVLIYKHRRNDGEWHNECYPVHLSRTPCNLGGERLWFKCPARGCGRRVAILYGGGIFACRRCYQLAYPSQRESWDDRAARKAERIREKLGWEPGILSGDGAKPKGMHWRTFEKLTEQHNKLADLSLSGILHRFDLRELGIDFPEFE